MSRSAGEEARDLAQLAWDRFNAGDTAAFWKDIVHPECIVATDPSWPDGGEFHGVAEFQTFMTRFLDAFGGIRFKPEAEPEVIGDAALLCGRWVGLGAASGIETASVPYWIVYRVRDGLLADVRFFFDEAKARKSAASPT